METCKHPNSTGPNQAMMEDGDLRRRCLDCGVRFNPDNDNGIDGEAVIMQRQDREAALGERSVKW